MVRHHVRAGSVSDGLLVAVATSVGLLVAGTVDGGAQTAVFTVALAVALPYEVRVDYATASGSAWTGSDYLAASGTVV